MAWLTGWLLEATIVANTGNAAAGICCTGVARRPPNVTVPSVEHDLGTKSGTLSSRLRVRTKPRFQQRQRGWNASGTAMPIAHGHVITSTEIATGSARARIDEALGRAGGASTARSTPTA
jgi:hypothetical protein